MSVRRVAPFCSTALFALLAGACEDSQPPGAASPTVAGAGQAAGGGGSSAAGAGGANVAGGAGGAAGGTALGGQAGAAAGAAALGGGAGGGAGGAAGAAGTGGNAGSSDPAADAAALAPLDGFQLLDPCDLSNYQVEPGSGAVCPQKNDVKNQHVSLQLGGDASVTYVVGLRVRGIVERYWYEGGTLDDASHVFYVGGVPTIGGYASACKNHTSELPFTLPTAMAPKDGCLNGFNVFGMSVSAPEQHYFLNYTTDKDGDRPPHAVYSQDYSVSIELQGQAKLDFYVIGSDEHQCYNHTQVVDGVELPMSPYVGEFLQFDVLSVKRKGM
ncbi:MAG TPA: hypothetical protein VHB79_23495 [Polyangiaceae bacterium]|nr:hypothetical protein [Polyangiaceae bacterium]